MATKATAQSVNNQSTTTTNAMMNAQLIQSTTSFESPADYVAAVRSLPCDQIISATEWDGIKTWRDLCVTLGIDFEAEAKGKARPAIDKVAKRVNGQTKAEPVAKAEKAPKVEKTAAKSAQVAKSESITVAKSDATSTHSAVAPSEPMPKRTNFQTEDAFDQALDAWFTANPERLVKQLEKVETVQTVAKAEQVKETAQVSKVASVAVKAKVSEKAAQAAGDIANFEKSAPSQPSEKTKPTETITKAEVSNVDETAQALAKLLRGLKADVNPATVLAQVEEQLKNFKTDLAADIEEKISQSALDAESVILNHLNTQIDQKLKGLKGQVSGTIEVKVNGQVTGKVTGLRHKCFDQILIGATIRDNMMLVGPAGSGKSTVCEQIAEALGMAFYGQSVCGQTSKSELLGYMDATGKYVATAFRQAFEHGGIFLLDEIDNGNPNVLSVLNSALANNWCSFADGMVKKHADFLLIAGANTYGTGASAMYVGRNQLDAATLDRFSIIDFPYDEELETALTADKSWCKVVQAVRKVLAAERVVISPRASIMGAKALGAGKSLETVMRERVIKGMPENLAMRAMNIARVTYQAKRK